jgi:hypothetical protein
VFKHVTFCSDIDKMLGGDVAVGEVTEFCGTLNECVAPQASVAFTCEWLEQGTCRGPLWAKPRRHLADASQVCVPIHKWWTLKQKTIISRGSPCCPPALLSALSTLPR